MVKCCKNCDHRDVGCHSTCDIYNKERIEAAKENKAISEYLNKNDYREDVIKRRKIRELKLYGEYSQRRRAKVH